MDTINVRERIRPTDTENCFATLGARLNRRPLLKRALPWLAAGAMLTAAVCWIPAPAPLALPAAAAAPAAELPRRNEVLHASDGLLSVWNYDTGLGGAAHDCINTVRWWDERGMHDAVFRGPQGLGWVEAVGAFNSVFGKVYLFVTASQLPGGDRSTGIRAFKLAPGGQQLQELERFFPEMPGADPLRSRVEWLWRPYAGMALRPFEVRMNDERRELSVRVTPPPGPARGEAGRFADSVFVLRFNGRELLYQPEGGGVTSARTTARLVDGE